MQRTPFGGPLMGNGEVVYPYHHATTVDVAALPEDVFAFVDDHARLSAHMGKRSWMMAGGRMSVETDAQRGKAVGSKIRMSGSVLGVKVVLEEAVVERVPPLRKVWETVGAPELVVIGPYRMGVRITPSAKGCEMTVSIDYRLPSSKIGQWLGKAFGRTYARWCTEKMAHDTRQFFSSKRVRSPVDDR